MADNYVTNAGSGGLTYVGALLSFSGDSAELPGVFQMVISGSEGSWTAAQIVGGAGAVTAGTQRMTLASDDPAVVALQLIDNAISGAGFNITQLGGANVPIGAGTEAAAVRVTIATDSTGVLSVDDNGGAITVDGTVAATQSGTWNITNVSGTVSLPTGAATAAKQPALGTAGSPSSDVISIQGVASGTVVPVSDGGGALTVDGTVGISGSVAVTGTFWQATQPVSGTVTANAGTNLNTSALALETGGNLAGAATSLAVIDDWDDGSDRCRVVGAAAEDAAAAGNPVLVAGRYDSTVRANETGDVATLAMTPEGYVRTAVETVDYAFDGDTRCQVKRFRVKCGNGANTLISAVASKKFRLRSLAMLATSATAVTVYLHTTTDTGVLGDSTDKLTFDLDGVGGPAGVVLPYNPDGWLQTSTANEALQATLSAAEEVWVIGTYIEVA